jgi:ubiquinone biosynthesis protein UbiJ
MLLLLQNALNKALQLDASLSTKLQPLQGKRVQLIITPLNLTFFIEFTAMGIQLSTDSLHAADTVIRSSPIHLLRMSVTPAAQIRALLNDDLQIEGNLELGLEIKRLLSNLDLDWEGELAQLTGDVVAHQIGRWVRGGIQRAQDIQTSLGTQCSEYLHEEARLFPPIEEVNDFFADIDELSLHVERLEAQLNYYRARHATS